MACETSSVALGANELQSSFGSSTTLTNLWFRLVNGMLDAAPQRLLVDR
jgi:hypothetical protein